MICKDHKSMSGKVTKNAGTRIMTRSFRIRPLFAGRPESICLMWEKRSETPAHMPDDARAKLQETLQRIINEGSGGLICIIL